MLRDKDAAGVIEKAAGRIDRWYLGGTSGPRGLSGKALAQMVRLQLPSAEFETFDDIAAAYRAARRAAGAEDRIIVFGSFHTVAAAMRAQCLAGADSP